MVFTVLSSVFWLGKVSIDTLATQQRMTDWHHFESFFLYVRFLEMF